MSEIKTVVINFGQGSLAEGFSHITVRLQTAAHLQPEQFVGSLSANASLLNTYRVWQSTYRALSNRLVLRSAPVEADEDELEIEPGGVTQVSQQSFEDISQQLAQMVNDWLASAEMVGVEQQLRSKLDLTDEIRVILETDSDLIRRLPWHCWDFLRDYPNAEIALSRAAYQRRETVRAAEKREQVRILAILGDRRGIDVEPELRSLQSLPNAEIELLVAPSREQFDRCLWDKSGWDILFFAGHSQTEDQTKDQTGRMYINEELSGNSLTIAQLAEALKRAIAHGLKLAIFNSCDGVGLAQALGQLQIPQVIVMREPVPNRVAQAFLQHFLAAFAVEQLPLYPAMRQARSRLQGLEDEFPGASWLPVLCQNPSVMPSSWAQLGGVSDCPYRGLAAFRTADAHLFFGRENAVDDLLSAVRQKPFVAVTGPSGSGKSSVVFAGVLPRLLKDGNWQILSCRPGVQPFDALAGAIASANSNHQTNYQNSKGKSVQDPASQLSFLEQSVALQHNPQALSEAIAQLQQFSRKRTLLVIDQFEELYTLCSPEDCQPFLDRLLDAVQTAPAFTLLLTLRADFYSYALSDRRLSDALQTGGYNLGPMDKAELKRAIAQPALQAQVTLESGLADKLIQATWAQAGRLPLLEFALTELWAQQTEGKLTHQAYDAIGGVEAALANHAEAVYAQLSSDDQRRMQRIFAQLVEPGLGTDATRRLASRGEVQENWNLVAQLASARLVVTNRSAATGVETVEIVHEALIRSWGRLEYWLQIDGEFRRWQEDLRRARRQWEKSEQEDAALLRGKRLLDAKDWYDSREDELSAADKQFIQRSLDFQAKEDKGQRRRRQVAFSSLTAGLLAAVGLGSVAWLGQQRAAKSEVQATVTSANALFVSGQRLDSLVETLKARHKLGRLAQKDEALSAEIERSLIQSLSRADEKNRLQGHTAGTTATVFSPDNRLIASADRAGTIKLWQANGAFLSSLEGHDDEIWGLAVSPDSQLIASASNDRTVKLWKPDGTLVRTLEGHRNEVEAVAFNPDGTRLVSADRNGFVKLWQPDGTLVKTFRPHLEKIDAIAFSPDGRLIATGSGDGKVKLSDLEGKIRHTLTGHSGSVRGVAFSPDGSTIASASADGTIKLWKPNGTLTKSLNAHNNVVYGIAFSPNGQYLASASDDDTVKLWQADGQLISSFRGHSDGATGIAFSPDGKTLASTSFDATVRLWQLGNPLITSLKGHDKTVRDAAFSPDGIVASASDDKTIRLWQRDGTLLKTLEKHNDIVYSLDFSPDGRTLVSGSKDTTVQLWSSDGSFQKTLVDQDEVVTTVAFSNTSNQLIASGGDDNLVKLWRLDGSRLATLAGHKKGVNTVVFSPDDRLIASSSDDGTIKLWRQDGSLVDTIKGHEAGVNGIAFSPNGEAIASASDDGTVRLWQQNGQPLLVMKGHKSAAIKVAFSPDGQQLASTSVDETVKIWDRKGNLLKTLGGYGEGVTGIAFSPEGDQLAVGSVDRTVTLWDLEAVLNADTVSQLSCDWADDYLKTNPTLSSNTKESCF